MRETIRIIGSEPQGEEFIKNAGKPRRRRSSQNSNEVPPCFTTPKKKLSN